jgi:hypothetical protein
MEHTLGFMWPRHNTHLHGSSKGIEKFETKPRTLGRFHEWDVKVFVSSLYIFLG